MVYPAKFAYEVRLTELAVEEENSVLGADLQDWRERQMYADATIDQHHSKSDRAAELRHKSQKDLTASEKDELAELSKSIEEIERDFPKRLEESLDFARQIDRTKARLRAKHTRVEYLSNLYRVYLRWAIVLGVSGLGLGTFGFVFWYLKLQRYQDSLLRSEARRPSPSAMEPPMASALNLRSRSRNGG